MQVIFLGNIDQVEIERERAHHLADHIGLQVMDQLYQGFALRFAVAFAQLDETGTQRFNSMKHFRVFVLE